MSRKPVAEVRIDEKNPTFIAPTSKEEFKKIMARYKKQNPIKYAAKEKALIARLVTLPTQEEVDAMIEAHKAAVERAHEEQLDLSAIDEAEAKASRPSKKDKDADADNA